MGCLFRRRVSYAFEYLYRLFFPSLLDLYKVRLTQKGRPAPHICPPCVGVAFDLAEIILPRANPVVTYVQQVGMAPTENLAEVKSGN